MKRKTFGVGAAKTIYLDQIPKPYDLSQYLGIASIEIKPPADLEIPVLPFKVKGKLLFPLCAHCAIHKTKICTHFDKRRHLFGCWCTPEIVLAVEKGYEVINVFQIIYYTETSDDLFKDYINHFYIEKLKNSGWPDVCSTDELKQKYIDFLLSSEGIEIKFEDIVENPSLRYINKCFLNILWGKFSQRNNLPKIEIVTTFEELQKLMTERQYNILDAFNINPECTLVKYDFEQYSVPTISCQNPILASMVACYGRIELYKAMETVGCRNLFYVDTDCLMFWENGDEISSQLNLGDSLGLLSNELTPEGNYITELVVLAPKSYAYNLKNPDKKGHSTRVVVKGITRNINNPNEQCNFDNFLKLLENEKSEIITSNDQFIKNCYEGTIYTKKMSKRITINEHKRVMLEDKTTLPYGYITREG